MNHDRIVRFEVGGEPRYLYYSQRALKALQVKHGLKSVQQLNDAIVEPVGLEKVLYEGLEGYRQASAPEDPPVPATESEAILDALSFLTVQSYVDRALVLAYKGPKQEKKDGEDRGKGKAQAPEAAARV